MSSELNTTSKLLRMFGQFHTELVKVKDALRNGDGLKDIVPAVGEEYATVNADLVSAIVDHFVNTSRGLRGETQSQLATDESEMLDEVQYMMAALADEQILLELEKPDHWSDQDFEVFRQHWLENLVESNVYGTSFAGERVFDHLLKLVKEGRQYPNVTQVAPVYLSLLSLGFSGRYRGTPNEQESLSVFRRRLFPYVAQSGRLSSKARMFSQAYQHLINPGERKLMASMTRWHQVVLGGLAVYLLISYVLWVSAVAPLDVLFD